VTAAQQRLAALGSIERRLDALDASQDRLAAALERQDEHLDRLTAVLEQTAVLLARALDLDLSEPVEAPARQERHLQLVPAPRGGRVRPRGGAR
jgi:hypothetical protein